MKRVSVIIPVYNAERTIERVLDSVLGQTAFDEILEIIIINDGSTDNSEDVISRYCLDHPDIQIIYIRQTNSGVSSARNRGLEIARGEFVALLDSDDLWLANKIQRQLQILDERPDVVFLGAAYNEKPFYRRCKRIRDLFQARIFDIYIKYFPVTPSVIFRRYAINKVGFFDESQRYGEDIGYYQKFCIYFNYFYLPEKLVSIGLDKEYFGSSGLTSNVKGMHQGEIQNLLWLKEEKAISMTLYLVIRSYIDFKYLTRMAFRAIRRIL